MKAMSRSQPLRSRLQMAWEDGWKQRGKYSSPSNDEKERLLRNYLRDTRGDDRAEEFLFMAAPELLDALKALADAYDSIFRGGCVIRPEPLTRARAAIAETEPFESKGGA
jgi:hypothetical protein